MAIRGKRLKKLIAAARGFRRSHEHTNATRTSADERTEGRMLELLTRAALDFPLLPTPDEVPTDPARTLDPQRPQRLANAALLWLTAEYIYQRRRHPDALRVGAALPHVTQNCLDEARDRFRAEGIDLGDGVAGVVVSYLPEWLLREVAGEPPH